MSCCNITDVVTPSANIGNSTTIPNRSHNTINTDTISNNSIAGSIKMNEENKKALKILIEKGGDEAVKHMFNPTGEKQLSYAEMRERYG
jgi:hypothetical protein